VKTGGGNAEVACWFLAVQGLDGTRNRLFDDKEGIIEAILGVAMREWWDDEKVVEVVKEMGIDLFPLGEAE
jgi:hypothetical protein